MLKCINKDKIWAFFYYFFNSGFVYSKNNPYVYDVIFITILIYGLAL